jgi:Zn-finger nucleic acid-binding protein
VDALTCPKCQGEMARRSYAATVVSQCPDCGGLFLDRSDTGSHVEAETDWHAHRASATRPMPRITPGMTEPPQARPHARSFLDALFRLGD